MRLALTAQVVALSLRREKEKLLAEVKLACECEGTVLHTLGITTIQNGFWLLDTGALLYSGITEVKLSQTFKNVAVHFAQEPLWGGVALKKLAFTPLEHYRVRLALALCGRIEHGLLRLLAERLREEIACTIERADLLEEPPPVARIRSRGHTHAERTQPP